MVQCFLFVRLVLWQVVSDEVVAGTAVQEGWEEKERVANTTSAKHHQSVPAFK